MIPLAERMRPRKLEDFIGQRHLLGSQGSLSSAIKRGKIHSMIFWGPPGVGKTTLAQIIAEQSGRPFFALSAINAGVKDIRETIEKAQKQQFFDRPSPILFIDEIHRFSKSQQDALLGAVEKGIITLIGATTENPSFEVISALLSRCQVYVLKPLEIDDLKFMIDNAIEKDKELNGIEIEVLEYESLLMFSGGDGRKLYNALEIVVQSLDPAVPIKITNELVNSTLQERLTLYDKSGEQHYDVVSAFIKSIRGSDPNASIYYLARMLDSGESIEFIARRLLIVASEDIGLANPNALLLATNCFQAIKMLGMPESRIVLSQATIYLACSAKSNSAYLAIDKALDWVRRNDQPPIPLHLRNAPTSLMKDLDYGKNYRYAHDFEGNFVLQEFLPETITGHQFYDPGNNAAENKIRMYLSNLWKTKYGY